jgi:hypothetical protein
MQCLEEHYFQAAPYDCYIHPCTMRYSYAPTLRHVAISANAALAVEHRNPALRSAVYAQSPS